jgi:hypothetical protein
VTLPFIARDTGLAGICRAELLSGPSRLDEPVTWVHVSEVMDAWRFLSGGEVLLSTGFGIGASRTGARAKPICVHWGGWRTGLGARTGPVVTGSTRRVTANGTAHRLSLGGVS